MSKVNRTRNRAVTVRMSDLEYDSLKNKVSESGLSQQSYIISAALDSSVTTADTLDVLKNISRTFAGVEQQLRGLGTNVNQMAHIANGTGMTPSASELEHISNQVAEYRKECNSVWQLIRSSIPKQHHTER
ncbi:MAG: plasmid mobilization relaxosome protein MobC [Lachnospiraceae bacterium]|nr:plasmid mobilization relaxosome protein MobC [Lachnospiraceae bacterium]